MKRGGVLAGGFLVLSLSLVTVSVRNRIYFMKKMLAEEFFQCQELEAEVMNLWWRIKWWRTPEGRKMLERIIARRKGEPKEDAIWVEVEE